MPNFYIEKLTVSGPSKESSTINFTKGLNIISGPSNTGKTCIMKCINYMFAASDKKHLPFSDDTGFDKIELFIKTTKGHVKLSRYVGKNTTTVESTDERILSTDYRCKELNIILLKLLNITEPVKIVKNKSYGTQNLTFRTFIHSLLIDEELIMKQDSILLQKSYTAKTSFKSALLYLIYRKNSTAISPLETDNERRTRKNALRGYITNQIENLASKKDELANALSQFGDIDVKSELTKIIDDLKQVEEDVCIAINESKSLLETIHTKDDELTELEFLFSRYSSLISQYNADLKRLEFITESNDSVTSSQATNCPFCDSHLDIEHEHINKEVTLNEIKTINIDLKEIQVLRKDIDKEITSIKLELSELHKQKNNIEQLINSELAPQVEELKKSIALYENFLALENEIKFIENMTITWRTDMFEIENEEKSELQYLPDEHFEGDFWSNFSDTIVEILKECNYTNLIDARFSKEHFDVVINGKIKSNIAGKGYRSFLNTIVVLAYRKFLHNTAMFDPSFFTIDTPMLGFDEGADSLKLKSLQNGLFNYFINTQNEGQLIVIENSKELPHLDFSGVNHIVFTKNENEGRYGFLHGVKSDI